MGGVRVARCVSASVVRSNAGGVCGRLVVPRSFVANRDEVVGPSLVPGPCGACCRACLAPTTGPGPDGLGLDPAIREDRRCQKLYYLSGHPVGSLLHRSGVSCASLGTS